MTIFTSMELIATEKAKLSEEPIDPNSDLHGIELRNKTKT